MELTFITEIGGSFTIEIDPGMEFENVMALLEAESGIPVTEQSISYDGRDLNNPKATVQELGITGHQATLVLKRKIPSAVAGRPLEHDAEMMRLQLLGDPNLMNDLRTTQPELAEAAQNNPTRFAELLRQTRERQHDAELARQREIEHLNADPFDVEAQRRIEEAIRQEAVMENLEHALEYSPESFGIVTMLYIDVEINGKAVKAFVDSGAQRTIMTPQCAEYCGIMRLLDSRFAGIAQGVGTAKILGRIHSTQLKVADLHLPCAITVMEGKTVDLLLGLDMLKSYQACIDLGKGVLRIQGREVRFLSEHELPENARQEASAEAPGPSSVGGPVPRAPAPNQPFSGHGNVLGSAPAQRPPVNPRASGALQSNNSRHPEASIKMIMDLGVTREVAISTLDAAGGNVDVAASLLF
ncbi:DNA damage-inducible protein 1 [Marasmius tenuissimus]|uniref:DNA damage-inducible protein 1 n=1 Tax=Marasmius tenuissimus TaxID=585030 RepID=A0ABR3A9F7_9AGAR|nr:DNA damage-inducible protein 1 [Marasmius tenuissimus]